mmetsp:Transcript_18821/g.26683  ORF Transcript_18821/g.26683 Transcript_18821/m.26683 type:complete len:191 (+) Transcript_18821:835-1407(+)
MFLIPVIDPSKAVRIQKIDRKVLLVLVVALFHRQEEAYRLLTWITIKGRALKSIAGQTPYVQVPPLLPLKKLVIFVSSVDVTLAWRLSIPVVTFATAYDDPVSQETYILVFHEALYFGSSMEHSLISPMQLHHNHGIAFPDQDDHNLTIPFELHGCISYFPTRLPTDTEIKHCQFIFMTEDSTWDPYNDM